MKKLIITSVISLYMDNRARIAMITERIYPLYVGGTELVMYNYAKILSKNYSISIFTNIEKTTKLPSLPNVSFVKISKWKRTANKEGNHSISAIISFVLNLILHSRKIKNYDLVILDSIHYFYPKILLNNLKKQNKAIITIFHEAWFDYLKSDSVTIWMRYLLPKFITSLIIHSDLIISVSDPTTRSLIDNYGAPEEKVKTIPTPLALKGEGDDDPLSVKDRKIDLIYVGRFSRIKRIPDIIEAIETLSKEMNDINVVLVGNGPIKKEVDSIVIKSRISSNVKLLGYVDELKKKELLKNSKIFIMPSEREGMSISTLEAMHYGCVPIVARPKFPEVFGTSHFIRENYNGLVYNVSDVKELAHKIRILLQDSSLLERLSINAIQTANTFNMEENDWKILMAVDELVHKKNEV